MKEIVLKKVRDHKELFKKPVPSVDATHIADGEVLARDEDGEFLFYQKPNFITDEKVAELFFNIKYPPSSRLSGIASMSEIFGFAPRDPVKKHPGRACKFNRTHKLEYTVLKSIGRHATNLFKKVAPDKFKDHSESLEVVNPNWIMPGSVYTSGIINCSNRLIYHTDNGNLKNCFSAMVTFRKEVRDGFLHCPDYDAIIKNPHGSILIFDGGRLLHGVTPFDSHHGKRITIVFYALEQIKNLEEDQEAEVEYFNKHLMRSYAGTD